MSLRRRRLSARLLLAAAPLIPLGLHAATPPVPAASVTVASRAPGASASHPVATKQLLRQLNQRMGTIDRDYARMNRDGRVAQVKALGAILEQLRGRPLHKSQQLALFKIEMRLRALRDELFGR